MSDHLIMLVVTTSMKHHIFNPSILFLKLLFFLKQENDSFTFTLMEVSGKLHRFLATFIGVAKSPSNLMPFFFFFRFLKKLHQLPENIRFSFSGMHYDLQWPACLVVACLPKKKFIKLSVTIFYSCCGFWTLFSVLC